jgi:O-antigen/teichoic acid export membrane protein
MVYTTPIYVGIWWIADPFIGVVYGEKWLPAAEPMAILVLAGIVRTFSFPCAALFAAQGRLTQEMVALAFTLVFVVVAVTVGVQWGLTGVAWGIAGSYLFVSVYFYILAYRILPTRMMDLVRAVMPGVVLNVPLMIALTLTHFGLQALAVDSRVLYLLAMALVGATVYAVALLFFPIPAIATEAARLRGMVRGLLRLPGKRA